MLKSILDILADKRKEISDVADTVVIAKQVANIVNAKTISAKVTGVLKLTKKLAIKAAKYKEKETVEVVDITDDTDIPVKMSVSKPKTYDEMFADLVIQAQQKNKEKQTPKKTEYDFEKHFNDLVEKSNKK